MNAPNTKKPAGDQPREASSREGMLAVREVMDLLESHGDQGGRWLWRDRWAEA